MFKKGGWKICGHCQGEGVCKNKIKSIQTFLWIIPIIERTSDASCLAAVGFDPCRDDAIVRCDVCKGKGYVYLDPNGDNNAGQ